MVKEKMKKPFFLLSAIGVAVLVASYFLNEQRGSHVVGTPNSTGLEQANDYGTPAKSNPDSNAVEVKTEPFIETSTVSNLPLSLVGTVIRPDQKQSMATIRLLELSRRENYFLTSSIEKMAVVEKIERERLIFKNLKTGKLEYIRIGPFDPKRAVSSKAMEDFSVTAKEFHVPNATVDKALRDLPRVLRQARAIPVMSPEDQVIGFKLVQIDRGSIYEELGLREGDILRAVNGTDLNSPAGAVELFNQLKASSLIELQIDRASRSLNLTYLIRE